MDEKLQALVSNATPALRSHFSHCNLTFSTPLVLVGKNKPKQAKKDKKGETMDVDEDDEEDEDEDDSDEDEAGENVGRNWKGVNLDKNVTTSKYSSLLLFEDKKEVHKLYDYISNSYASIESIKGDVPTLLSTKPFRNSILTSLNITRNDNYVTPTKEEVHIMEISGPMLPSTLAKLSYVLAKSAGDYFVKSHL
eukprot:UN33435